VISSVGQYDEKGNLVASYDELLYGENYKLIGYVHQGTYNYIIPCVEIIPTFVCPCLWKSQFWFVLHEVKQRNPSVFVTRTRFFLTSLLGGILAKCWKKKRVHIEHGVDYVKLAHGWQNGIARLYDQFI
jgi:hypothetical protein